MPTNYLSPPANSCGSINDLLNDLSEIVTFFIIHQKWGFTLYLITSNRWFIIRLPVDKELPQLKGLIFDHLKKWGGIIFARSNLAPQKTVFKRSRFTIYCYYQVCLFEGVDKNLPFLSLKFVNEVYKTYKRCRWRFHQMCTYDVFFFWDYQ